MICSLTISGLGSFTISLALGFEIVSLRKIWKPISNVPVVKKAGGGKTGAEIDERDESLY